MTIKLLSNEIFEKSYNRESLERLLTKEIKKKVELALSIAVQDGFEKLTADQITAQILKS